MSGVEEDESGGGVMIVFSEEPEMRAQVAQALEYTTQALRQHRLLVTQHNEDSASKTPKPRCVLQ